MRNRFRVPHADPGVIYRTRTTAMPTIESRIAPDGAVTYRAKVRIKGARQVSASFSRKTDAAKWGHATEVAIREDRYFRSPRPNGALRERGRSLRQRGTSPQTENGQVPSGASSPGGAGSSATSSSRTSRPELSRSLAENCSSSRVATSARGGPPRPTDIWRRCPTFSVSLYGNGSGLKPIPHTGYANSRSRGDVIASSPRTIARACWSRARRHAIRVFTT